MLFLQETIKFLCTHFVHQQLSDQLLFFSAFWVAIMVNIAPKMHGTFLKHSEYLAGISCEVFYFFHSGIKHSDSD